MRLKSLLGHSRLFLCVFLVLFVISSSYAKSVKLGNLGCDAPKLEGVEWVKGDAVKMQKGSIYIIEFWATWCGPCISGIPHLTEVQKKYKDKNVTVIGISKETNETVAPFVEKKGEVMDYTIGLDTNGEISKGYMKAFGQGGIPHAFIIDKAGKIAWRGHPAIMDEPLEQIIAGTFDTDGYSKKLDEEKKKREQAKLEAKKKREALDKKISKISAKIEKNPKNVRLLLKRAKIYLGDSFTTDLSYNPGDMTKAFEDYKKVLTLDPKDKNKITEHIEFFEAFNDQTDERNNRLKAFTDKYPKSIRVPFAVYSLYYEANKNKDYKLALKYVTIADKAKLKGRFGEYMSERKTTLEEKIKAENAKPKVVEAAETAAKSK